MPSNRPPKVIANSNALYKTLQPAKNATDKICKVLITPLEHTSFKNMYFSLINTQSKSAPKAFNVLNLNPSNLSANPVGTITIVDINEIKKRPLEIQESNNRKIAKIKPVLQKEPSKTILSIKRPVDEISTKYEKRFFLSFVCLQTINFDKFIKTGPLSYRIKPIETGRVQNPTNYKRTKVTFASPPFNHITPKRNNIASRIKRICKNNNITLKNRINKVNNIRPRGNNLSEERNITPEVVLEPRRKLTQNGNIASSTTTGNEEPFSPKKYHLVFENNSSNKFIDPYESRLQAVFSFESVAYKISSMRNGIKLPSRQWCCSLWQHIVSNRGNKGRVITKYKSKGSLIPQTLHFEDNIVAKRICSFGEIIKMKSFSFRRYQLGFQDNSVIMEPDFCVTVYRNGDYDIRVRGNLLDLYAAPLKVKNISDIEILLNIIDSVKLTEICVD